MFKVEWKPEISEGVDIGLYEIFKYVLMIAKQQIVFYKEQLIKCTDIW